MVTSLSSKTTSNTDINPPNKCKAALSVQILSQTDATCSVNRCMVQKLSHKLADKMQSVNSTLLPRQVDGVAMLREGRVRNPRARVRYVEQPELEGAETRWPVPVEFGEHGRGAGPCYCETGYA